MQDARGEKHASEVGTPPITFGLRTLFLSNWATWAIDLASDKCRRICRAFMVMYMYPMLGGGSPRRRINTRLKGAFFLTPGP